MSKKSKRHRKKVHEILGGHTKRGKLFTNFPEQPISPVSYVRFILPELIWLAILNSTLGPRKTAQVVEIFGLTIRTTPETTAPPPLFATAMGELTSAQKDRILAELTKQNHLNEVGIALQPLALLYPQFPIKWLLNDNNHGDGTDYLASFKVLLQTLQDKTSRSSVLMVAQAVYGSLVSHALLPPAGLLDDFDEVLNYPETDRSQALASIARSIVLTVAGGSIMNPEIGEWSSYFWQRGLELEPVDYNSLLRGIR